VGHGPLALQVLAQRLTVEELHDQERTVGRVDAEVVDDDDVRVVELAGDARLALEAGVELRVGPQLRVDELDGDPPFEGLVDGLVDAGHTATTTDGGEPVAAADEGG